MGNPATSPPSPGQILARRAEIASMAWEDFQRWQLEDLQGGAPDTESPEVFAKLFTTYAQRWVEAAK